MLYKARYQGDDKMYNLRRGCFYTINFWDEPRFFRYSNIHVRVNHKTGGMGVERIFDSLGEFLDSWELIKQL